MTGNSYMTVNKSHLEDCLLIKIGNSTLSAIIAEPFTPKEGLECILILRHNDKLYMIGTDGTNLTLTNSYKDANRNIRVVRFPQTLGFFRILNEKEVNYYLSLFEDKGYNQSKNSWF